jgi:hypothetical protein
MARRGEISVSAGWRAAAQRTSLWVGVVAAALAVGCGGSHGKPRLTSEMPVSEIRSTLDANVQPGMTLGQVNGALDKLGISDMRRRAYAGNPDQLLVRIAPVSGFWRDMPYEEFRYVDAWFVFSPEKQYQRVDLEEKRVRVQAGQWMDPPFQSPDVLPNVPRAVPGY